MNTNNRDKTVHIRQTKGGDLDENRVLQIAEREFGRRPTINELGLEIVVGKYATESDPEILSADLTPRILKVLRYWEDCRMCNLDLPREVSEVVNRILSTDRSDWRYLTALKRIEAAIESSLIPVKSIRAENAAWLAARQLLLSAINEVQIAILFARATRGHLRGQFLGSWVEAGALNDQCWFWLKVAAAKLVGELSRRSLDQEPPGLLLGWVIDLEAPPPESDVAALMRAVQTASKALDKLTPNWDDKLWEPVRKEIETVSVPLRDLRPAAMLDYALHVEPFLVSALFSPEQAAMETRISLPGTKRGVGLPRATVERRPIRICRGQPQPGSFAARAQQVLLGYLDEISRCSRSRTWQYRYNRYIELSDEALCQIKLASSAPHLAIDWTLMALTSKSVSVSRIRNFVEHVLVPHVLPRCEGYDLALAGPGFIAEVAEAVAAEHSARTFAELMRTFDHFIAYAKNGYGLLKNVTRSLYVFTEIVAARSKRVFTAASIERFLLKLEEGSRQTTPQQDSVYCVMFFLMAFGAVRFGEAANICQRDIYFDESQMWVLVDSKTEAGRRQIPLHDLAPPRWLAWFRRHLAVAWGSQSSASTPFSHILTRAEEKGDKPESILNRVYENTRYRFQTRFEGGKKLRMHTLRHTAINRWIINLLQICGYQLQREDCGAYLEWLFDDGCQGLKRAFVGEAEGLDHALFAGFLKLVGHANSDTWAIHYCHCMELIRYLVHRDSNALSPQVTREAA